MLKKLAVAVLAVQGFSAYANSAVENFDWGPGVPGRESFVSGGPVAGIRVQFGNSVIQDSGKVPAFFSGLSGPGRGVLRLQGQGNAIGFACPVSGITVMKAEGNFRPGAVMQGIRGFWIGFQSAAADKSLLNNQTTDHLFVQLNPEGAIVFRSVIGGITNNAETVDGRIQFAPGDLVKMELTVNLADKTASVKVTGTGAGNVKVRVLKWTTEKVPDWSMIMVNQTGDGELLLDSVEVRTEPAIVG